MASTRAGPVPNDYDPLLAKLIAWGNSREETIARLRRALEESTITGIKTNIALFRRLLTEPDFLRNEIHTKWLDQLLARKQPASPPQTKGASADAAAIAAAVYQATQAGKQSGTLPSQADISVRCGQTFSLETGRPSRSTGSDAMKFDVQISGKTRTIELQRNSEPLADLAGWCGSRRRCNRDFAECFLGPGER